MRTGGRFAWAAACLVLTGGCGDSSGPSNSELAGTWQVVKCEYVSPQGLGTVDLIAGGGSGTLVLAADGGLRLQVTPMSGPPIDITGTYKIDGIDLMQVTPAGVTWHWGFDMAFSAHRLELTNGDGEYDFDQDGHPDAAWWNLEMTR